MHFGFGHTVRVINRVVDKAGNRVPYEGMFSGEAIVVRDTIDLPIGVARILIQGSMFKIDPVNGQAQFKLGCTKLDTPTTDLTEAEVNRLELLERELLPESVRKKTKTERIHNPINPELSRGPRSIRMDTDGVQPGEFGFRD